MSRGRWLTAVTVAAAVGAAAPAAHAGNVHTRDFLLTIEGTKTRTFGAAPAEPAMCRDGIEVRGQGAETITFRTSAAVRVRLLMTGRDSMTYVLTRGGTKMLVPITATRTATGNVATRPCPQTRFTDPTWRPADVGACVGTGTLAAQADFAPPDPRRPAATLIAPIIEDVPGCSARPWTAIAYEANPLETRGSLRVDELLRSRRAVTVRTSGRESCSNAWVAVTCTSEVTATVRLVPQQPPVGGRRGRGSRRRP